MTARLARLAALERARAGGVPHPADVLRQLFLDPRGINVTELGRHLGMSVQHASLLVSGRRTFTAETAWKLAGAFGTTPEMWLHLQADYDLAATKPRVRTPPFRKGRGRSRG